jgi:hypothetical protein
MKTIAQTVFNASLLLALAAVLMVPDASAGNITIGFSGHVAGTGNGDTLPTGVQLGYSLSGSFGYNPALPASSQGVYQFGGGTVTPTALFAIPTPQPNPTGQFGDSYSATLNPNTYTITITDTGPVGATLVVKANSTGAGFSKPGGAFIQLTFTSSTYTGFALPQSNAQFDAAFGNQFGAFLWDPDGTGASGPIDNIDGIPVPEPSSFILLGLAMSTCGVGFAISRRKLAKAF